MPQSRRSGRRCNRHLAIATFSALISRQGKQPERVQVRLFLYAYPLLIVHRKHGANMTPRRNCAPRYRVRRRSVLPVAELGESGAELVVWGGGKQTTTMLSFLGPVVHLVSTRRHLGAGSGYRPATSYQIRACSWWAKRGHPSCPPCLSLPGVCG